MKTSERISALETRVKSAFALADARAAVATQHAPVAKSTPAQQIASAVILDRLQADAPRAASRIRDGLKAAVRDAESEIAAIAKEAEAAHHVAGYIVGKAVDLPAGIPADIANAALVIKGQTGAGTVARQLQLAAENAEREVARLKSRYVQSTKLAARVAMHKRSAQIYRAAGLTKEADRHESLRKTFQELSHRSAINASKRRLGQ